MAPNEHVVLLVGSPKGKGGTSHWIGKYLMDRLTTDDGQGHIHHLGRSLRKEDAWAQVMADVDGADTVILSFPLYWDALPSHVIRALEMMAAHRSEVPHVKQQSLVAIVNNGFPEPWHNQVALRICKRFAQETGFKWAGGVNVGGGAALGARPLDEMGGRSRGIRDLLDGTANRLAGEDPEPRDDVLQLFPSWFNLVFGGMGWRQQARKEGARGRIKDRPYE